ncbi:type II toxin-antitoxin system HicB family antitoxin [Halolamina salifodinae]|uniref:Putative RNase H-like HicB family nuclease n=1 Tax=Halolamina salifodinae TaxID=1202767 RepID=A0A8T4GXJ3_9EURY|nr:type II toxin-antitoxin system HicB family antitoxin [Halolamina salifodinae]MBP1986892.1 putative RNase H-like HicB family nuclease [Halolamina salifodinae]
MSIDSEGNPGRTPSITLTENPDGNWTARNLVEEVSAQGETREEALDNLDDVVAAVRGGGGRKPTEEELQELGIDPEENVSGGELPDVLK